MTPEALGIVAALQLALPDFSLDVDLAIPGNSVTGLFGPSGSGKSTLLRCIAGLERRVRGRLTVRGEVWQDERTWVPTHHRRLGYVFQEASLFAHLSVLGNVRYGLVRSGKAARHTLDQAIDLLGIGPLLERRPEKLSGGERQRVAMARALASDPKLLLLDEPLAALDLQHKQEILPYLERLHDSLEIPVLYVSHAPDEVARFADHLIVMAGGRAVASGPLQEMLSRLDLPVRLGEEAGAVLQATIGAIDEQWHLARADFPGGSLWAMDRGVAVGRKVRVRVLARDVSLADSPGSSSIQNVLRGVVDGLADDGHPGLALVRVCIGPSALLARLTKRAATALHLERGREVWVQVKSVALIE